MIVELTGYLHSWTPVLSSQSWEAFAGASEGGGTPPDWTQSDDPRTTIPPHDAAGSLWRVGEGEIPTSALEITSLLEAEIAMGEGFTLNPVGAYFSCGGRGVFLIECLLDGIATDTYYVVVSRGNEPTPRLGASEESLCRRIGIDADMVVVLDRSIEC